MALVRSILVLIVLACVGVCEAAPLPEWTIMVYFDGDNNLEHMAILDLLEMEQAIPEGVEIVVLMDRHRHHSRVFDNWTGTRLYRVRRAPFFDMKDAADGKNVPLPPTLASELLEDWGEADMADPATLVRFITTVGKRFPAKRYALIPWDHGSGASANGMLSDEDGGNGRPGKGSMRIEDFIRAVAAGAETLPRKRFDLLKYELCLMGQLDVMAETASVADVAFASPPIEPGQGSDYLRILPLFRADISTEDLARRMVDCNIQYYTALGRPAAFSAFRLAAMPAVVQAFQNLTTTMRSLVPNSVHAFTRATCFATHHEDLLEDMKRNTHAMSAVELYDWLDRLAYEVPALNAQIAMVRAACKEFVYHTGTTPNFPECRGVTVYLPLRRANAPKTKPTLFARASGLASYLTALYQAQDSAAKAPQITAIALGAPRLRPGAKGTSPEDFDLVPLTTLTPFSRHVVRFSVSGTGILLTTMVQFEQRGAKRYVHCEQLVADHSAAPKAAAASDFAAFSPRYRDGTTVLLREISQLYKVSNGSQSATISVRNTSLSRDILKNTSIGYGLYRDATTGGAEIPVQVHFSNRLRVPLKMIGYQLDAHGNMRNMREITPRNDGVFRPGVTVFDANMRSSLEYGPEIPLASGIFVLTVAMIDQGAHVGAIVSAETISGARAVAVSQTVPVQHNPQQKAMEASARSQGLANLFGRYAMIQFASSAADDLVALPTFQTIEFTQKSPTPTFTVFANGKERGHGLLTWFPYGTPQILLYKKSELAFIPYGETIQAWYAFLQGSGTARVWYCIGMGDGTRWSLVPLEQYTDAALSGIWKSATETWHFEHGNVTLTRDGTTRSGTYRLDGAVLTTTHMPSSRYAVALDPASKRLTLMTPEGRASFLTREGSVSLLGTWRSQNPQGADLLMTSVPNTAYFNMRLRLPNQAPILCTCALRDNKLYATFENGSRAIVDVRQEGDMLTLTFPMYPPITFVRQQ